MQSERWQNCTDIFNAAAEQPREHRAALLDRACNGDAALRNKVELLLKYHDQAGDFIASPAFEIAPEFLLDDADALVGQHLGHYRIESVLGVGGMGVVYLAHDEQLGRNVALKLLPQSLVSNEVQLERLKREARTASALNHPNIVTIHEVGEVNGTHYIATEFIEGTTLRERMTRGPIPPNEALEIAEQIASALSVAHGAGIVHCDIKPENIMLRPDGYVKVLDFGIAKFTQQETLAARTSAGGQITTQQGKILGTTRYMSPEQARGQTVDARSDLWSLGVVLYEMLAGCPPFDGETPTDVIAAVLQKPPKRVEQRATIVPPALQSAVEKSLRKDALERYQTAEEILSELRAIEAQTDGIGSALAADRIRGSNRSTRTARWIGVAAVAVLLVSLAAFYGRRSGRADRAATPAPIEKSIAVLPFENLSKDEENAFFAAGVQDEILANLAKVADLKVISRTSVMQYTSSNRRNLREIGRQLGVAHVLEGSVQRTANRVKVTAQLIDARSDAHLWAQTYDRDFADVFAIQSEIAQQIANQLRAKLSVAEKAAIEERPTDDLVAYAYYTKAREINIYDNWEGAEQSAAQKVELLEKATQRDPNFALAYCALAKTQAALFSEGAGSSDLLRTHLELAKKAADAALRVRPDVGEAHLELARYYFYAGERTGDFDRAREELTIARRTLPNNSEALFMAARIDRRQNRWDSALANFQKANDLDPRNTEFADWLGGTYFEMRRYDDWEQFIKKCAASGAFEGPWIQNWLADMKLAQGDPVAAQSLLEQVPLDFNPNNFIWQTRLAAALYLRDYDAANRVIAAAPAKWADQAFSGQPPESWADGQVARARGDKQKALAVFAAARKKMEATWGDKPKDGYYVADLAMLDAGLGRKEEAIREALHAVELMPIAKDSLAGPRVVTSLALVYAWTGERDRALEQLEIVAKIPAGPSYGDLKFNPCWDSLRGDPRFEKIVASLAPKETAAR